MALFTDFAPALTFAIERAVPITGDSVDDNLFTLNQLSQHLCGFGPSAVLVFAAPAFVNRHRGFRLAA